jgi:hypothetical protein
MMRGVVGYNSERSNMHREEPKIGAHGKPVVFLHPKDCNGVLVELEES